MAEASAAGDGGGGGGGSAAEGAAAEGPAATTGGPVGMRLEEVRGAMHSAAFVQLVAALTGHVPARCASAVRRFRPGLDYTLAHVGTQATEPTIDATLSFVAASSREQAALWESGDVGGFECHVPASAEDAHGAAEVYRADESSAGVTSIHAQPNALSLVVRGTDSMKFVKFVSASAPGSRWDVAAEYPCPGARG